MFQVLSWFKVTEGVDVAFYSFKYFSTNYRIKVHHKNISLQMLMKNLEF